MIIGIDPGMSGAIVVRNNGKTKFFDIPTIKTKSISGNNKKAQSDIDITKLVDIVSQIALENSDCSEIVTVCEHSAGLAFKGTSLREEHFDNSKTAWKKGYNFGVIRAVFATLGITFTYTPRPGDWKRKLGLTNSKLTYEQKKETARLEAIRLFPELEKYLKRKKDSDRAEALLLTVWAKLKGAKK